MRWLDRQHLGAASTLLTVMWVAGCGGSTTVSVPVTRSASISPVKSVATTQVPAKASPPTTPGAGGIKVNTAGAVLPNSARTPGAINPSVTQANIGRTICMSGWTATVRPPTSVTTQIKVAQLASGYTYRGDKATGDYEEDHLISLELGGAPSAVANLWPEPYNTPEGARVKDVIESKLHTMVCGRSITLAAAQRAIATNWWTAYQQYVDPAPTSSTSRAPAPSSSKAPAPPPAGASPTALCKDGTFSFAVHHQGACSRHEGVRVFYM
jgi:hypothetical protein